MPSSPSDLLRLQVAAGDKGFIQGDGARGVGVPHFRDLAFQMTQVRDEGETFVPANAAARLEGGFNRAFLGSRGRGLRFVIIRAPLLLSCLVSLCAGEELRC